MKILKTILFVACIALMSPATTQAQEAENFIMDLTEYTIKFGHNANFVEGVKKWKKCYKDNKGTSTWNVWHRLQGKGNVYVATSFFRNWSEMDDADTAGKTCRSIGLEFITPHIESVEYNTARPMLEFSRKADLGDDTIVWVNNFKVNDREAFNDIIKEVSSTINKKEGDRRGYWYRNMAGESADYFVSTPFKNFADLDKDRDSVWKVFESVHGEKKAKDIRKRFNATLDDAWSYTYTLETDLSMN